MIRVGEDMQSMEVDQREEEPEEYQENIWNAYSRLARKMGRECLNRGRLQAIGETGGDGSRQFRCCELYEVEKEVVESCIFKYGIEDSSGP